MEGGCLAYPGASTVASQPLARILPHGWQVPATQSWAPIPDTRHTDETVEGRRIGMGGGEDAK